VFSAARHLFGAAVVRTRWPRGHWSLLARHGRGAVRKVHARRHVIATPSGGNVGRRWLPVWLPQHLRSNHTSGLIELVRGSDLRTCLVRSEGLEPPTF
jgi:hypothetical protein